MDPLIGNAPLQQSEIPVVLTLDVMVLVTWDMMNLNHLLHPRIERPQLVSE